MALDDPPEPRVVPVPGGGLQFEWQTATRELELEVLPDGSVEFLTVAGEHMQEGPVSSDQAEEVRRLIGWLKGQ
jgi:hypothetical protein